MPKIISANLKIFLYPAFYLGIILVLFLLIFNLGLPKITEQRQKIASEGQNEKILGQKENLLRDLQNSVGSDANLSARALPENNPSLVVISQIKALALKNAVTLDNFKSSSEIKDKNLSSTDVVFDVEGTFGGVMNFLKNTSSFAPVARLKMVKITTSGDLARASTTLKAFWAAYPTKLPSLTEPVKELSGDDKTLLEKISALTQPAFVEIVPQPAGVRPNPFE